MKTTTLAHLSAAAGHAVPLELPAHNVAREAPQRAALLQCSCAACPQRLAAALAARCCLGRRQFALLGRKARALLLGLLLLLLLHLIIAGRIIRWPGH